MHPEKFTSVKNGLEHIFFFTYYIDFHSKLETYVYRFQIWREGKEPTSIMLKIMPDNKDLKVIDLYPSDDYRGVGMSVAFILKAKALFNKRIISSSRLNKHFGEDRWKDAENYVWKPMVAKGLAAYNSKFDYYYTI